MQVNESYSAIVSSITPPLAETPTKQNLEKLNKKNKDQTFSLSLSKLYVNQPDIHSDLSQPQSIEDNTDTTIAFSFMTLQSLKQKYQPSPTAKTRRKHKDQ
jgi:hypothetical protein